jgi:hypothetical protein
MNTMRGAAKIPRDGGSRDNERFTIAGQLISVQVFIFLASAWSQFTAAGYE